MKKTIFRGITAVIALLFAVVFFLGKVLQDNASSINSYFGITGASAISGDAEIKYPSEFGDFNDDSVNKLLDADAKITAQLQEEGSVLLKNDAEALPLKSNEKKVTLFGRASADIVYRGQAGGPNKDSSRFVDLKKALNDVGITINDTLYNAYAKSSTVRVVEAEANGTSASIGEEKISFYTNDLKNTFSSFSDAAIIVLSRYGGESKDLQVVDVDGVPQLSLHQNEKDLLQMVKDSTVFSKRIVLLNTVYAMDLDWLDEYSIDACLWIGNPGYQGLTGVANVLVGKASPSGKLPMTWASSSLSSPAMQNMGGATYSNASEFGLNNFEKRYVVYQEGIYVGYKYYETRYEDTILNQGNASSAKGAYNGASWSYANEMCYPFGFGLSYSSFEQKLNSVTYDAEKDTYKVTVSLKNTGSFAAKEAVELYVQTPFTDYDKDHGLEKPSIQLVGYNKPSSNVNPGETVTVDIEFDRYYLASYDIKADSNKGGYILDAGNYYFAIGNGAHEALNNILQVKGQTSLVDHNGAAVTGDVDCVKTIEMEFDDTSYAQSQTGQDVDNLFADADPNYYGITVNYLSRTDWDNTYPVDPNNQTTTFPAAANLAMNSALKEALQSITKNKNKTPTIGTNGITYGVYKGIVLYDMIGLDYDDPKWKEFVEQLSLTDLSKIAMTNFGSEAIESIGRPKTIESEGPEGCRGKYLYGSKNDGTCYSGGPVVAATFNPELQERLGELFAENCLFCGIDLINGPGCDILRTPYGGRASEYYSEDAMLSNVTALKVITGFRTKGVLANIKHFALNEQESARQGIAVFANEQSMREIYFKAFEGAFTSGKLLACMTSYNRVGAIYTAANENLLQNLVRNEWGYKGYLAIDYISENEYSSGLDCILAGSNVLMGNSDRSKILSRAAAKDGEVLKALQEGAHYVLHAFANSQMANRLSSTGEVDSVHSWWETAITAGQISLGVLTGASIGLYVFFFIKDSRRKEHENIEK